MFYGYYYDTTYLLVIIAGIITMIASARVSSTFKKYNRVRSHSGLTGEETARMLLSNAGITDVSVEHIQGNLNDHYDPRSKTLRLSSTVFGNSSVAAVAVAAHECGHAIQHNEEYIPLQIRSAIAPAANIGSKAGIPIIILGVILGSNQLFIQAGIWIFAIAVLFQFVTLPVEFNASRRALALLESQNILSTEENKQSKQVLSAAAMTYVAAAGASVMQLLRLILLFGGRDRD